MAYTNYIKNNNNVKKWLLPIKLYGDASSTFLNNKYRIMLECMKGLEGDIIGPTCNVCYSNLYGNITNPVSPSTKRKCIHQRSVILPPFSKQAKTPYYLSSNSSNGTVTARCISGYGTFNGIETDWNKYISSNDWKWNYSGLDVSGINWLSDWSGPGDSSMWGKNTQWASDVAPLCVRFNLKSLAQAVYNKFGYSTIDIFADLFLTMNLKEVDSPSGCLGLNFLTDYYFTKTGGGGQVADISGSSAIINPDQWGINEGGQGHDVRANSYLIGASNQHWGVSLQALLHSCTTDEKNKTVSEFYAWPISFASDYNVNRWPKSVACRTCVVINKS